MDTYNITHVTMTPKEFDAWNEHIESRKAPVKAVIFRTKENHRQYFDRWLAARRKKAEAFL